MSTRPERRMLTALARLFWADAMGGLHHRLLAEHDFGLINPLQMEPEFWQDLDSVPIVPVAMRGQEHLMPRLVQIRGLETSKKVDLLERSDALFSLRQRPLFSALLNSKREFGSVRQWIAGMLIQRVPGVGEVFFRFHDPRVFAHLPRILGPGRVSCLLGPVIGWCYHNHLSGKWQTFHKEQRDGTAAFSIKVGSELDAILRLPWVNKCAVRSVERTAAAESVDELVKHIASSVNRAIDEEKLSDPDDIMLFVDHCIKYGNELHSHDAMRRLLESVRSENASYIGACLEMGEASIQMLVGSNSVNGTSLSHVTLAALPWELRAHETKHGGV